MIVKTISKQLLVAAFLLSLVQAAAAQTADEIIEKYLAASGGRAALGKLKSRSMTGTITLSTPAGNVSGPIEVLNQSPNKSRTFIKLDLTAFGIGQVVQDQRFDGVSGYMIDSLQGNRDIAGDQLANMRNGGFPNPLLNYKEAGATVELGGKEKVGERDAYLLIFKPKTGPVVRQYIDAESYLAIKTMVKVNVPQIGGDLEQTTELSDYRDVDGVKIAFQIRSTSSIQTFSVNVTKVEHNIQIDPALFSKPAEAAK
jgi:outer membrane lipoprotein-sorting protein